MVSLYMHESSEQASFSRREFFWNVGGPLFFLVLVVIGGRFVDLGDIRERILAAGALGPLLLIGLKAGTLIFAPIGGGVLYPLAGAIFGFWKGFGYVMAGELIGATASFAISRMFGRRIALYFLLRPGMQATERALGRLETARGLAYARVLFSWFPEAVNYGAGLTRVPLWKFTLITAPIGAVPVAVMVLFGDAIVRFQKTPLYLGIVAVVVVMTLWWLYRQVRPHRVGLHEGSP